MKNAQNRETKRKKQIRSSVAPRTRAVFDLRTWCVYLLVKCSALWASGSEPTGSDVGIE